jgi:hypothetical protein
MLILVGNWVGKGVPIEISYHMSNSNTIQKNNPGKYIITWKQQCIVATKSIHGVAPLQGTYR